MTDISRSFHGQRVVDQVSLRINPGQVTCLLGPSGCGKSTTLRIIAGVDRQDQGQILIDGQVVCDGVSSLPAEQRSIGLMFQDFALFPHLSVGDNVGFGVNGGRDVKRAAAETLLEKVGLRHRIDQYPHALSGGEQQRVALARALAPKPRIMLMDEP
ncbi:MAG TPA: Fe3+/spermidine/putrescine ABC transporter ATP-binding protein, partial [Rhodobacteraceae bacterium]|nr:Fe3+/spermidine/putrescine ABC transporter ATP-binding protein [Paracoccaceae bacterium]